MSNKIKTAKGWVIVSAKGKIKVDTVSLDRESAGILFDQCDLGSRIVRCSVVVDLNSKEKPSAT